MSRLFTSTFFRMLKKNRVLDSADLYVYLRCI